MSTTMRVIHVLVLACGALAACASSPRREREVVAADVALDVAPSVAPSVAIARGADLVAVEKPARRVLRIAADPNNLPFSDSSGGGFEPAIAAILADELDADLAWTWRAQRRGFFRETLGSGACDVVLGVPAHFERASTTAPYYRSTYVFVSRADRALAITSFDDPRLRELKVGVPVVGEDGASTPPAEALARRGIVGNVVGYSVYGDYREPSPPSRIVEAVASGDLDLAIVWGPLAGPIARAQAVELVLTPASDPDVQTQFEVAIGVRRGNEALRDELDAALARRRPEIEALLDRWGVPRVPLGNSSTESESSRAR